MFSAYVVGDDTSRERVAKIMFFEHVIMITTATTIIIMPK